MKTSKTIVLKGNKNNPESAEQHIEFPGGSISVCRTSDNNYWAHVWVNTEKTEEAGIVLSRQGKIKTTREDNNHFAVLITLDD